MAAFSLPSDWRVSHDIVFRLIRSIDRCIVLCLQLAKSACLFAISFWWNEYCCLQVICLCSVSRYLDLEVGVGSLPRRRFMLFRFISRTLPYWFSSDLRFCCYQLDIIGLLLALLDYWHEANASPGVPKYFTARSNAKKVGQFLHNFLGR